ncbi:MAG TPA: SDR family oxidoreductase [Acidimicrobiales bacterium]|nr:SDR family oxidoreductase [Acidimicrobiales bacterium]
MELRLDGKVALVTGASRGIGLAIATRFAEAGASVMLSSRKAEALENAVGLIASASADAPADRPFGPTAWHVANAGDESQAEACVAATLDRFGALDILVNNAATNPHFGLTIDIDESRAAKTVQVNQLGVLAWTRAAWRAAMAEHGGAVLNLSSVGGLQAEGGIGWYNVTKAAVIHLTRQLAGELGPKVRVNALAPGLVKTDFAKALWEPAEEAIASRLPMRRLGMPDDIAKAALFLCSDAASWITGDTLVIDGGALAMPSGGVG